MTDFRHVFRSSSNTMGAAIADVPMAILVPLASIASELHTYSVEKEFETGLDYVHK